VVWRSAHWRGSGIVGIVTRWIHVVAGTWKSERSTWAGLLQEEEVVQQVQPLTEVSKLVSVLLRELRFRCCVSNMLNGLGAEVDKSNILASFCCACLSNTQATKLHTYFFDASTKGQRKGNWLVGNFVPGAASMRRHCWPRTKFRGGCSNSLR